MPASHLCAESQLPWYKIDDDLPRTRTEDYPELAALWTIIVDLVPRHKKNVPMKQGQACVIAFLRRRLNVNNQNNRSYGILGTVPRTPYTVPKTPNPL